MTHGDNGIILLLSLSSRASLAMTFESNTY